MSHPLYITLPFTLFLTLTLLLLPLSTGDDPLRDDSRHLGKTQEIIVRRGHNGSLPCIPAQRANKVDKLEWWKEDKKLVEIKETRMITWEAENHVAFLPETGALYFRSAQYQDDGEYLCTVNEKKTIEGIVRLFIQDVPDMPGQPIIMGFTSRSINVSWPPSFNNHNSPILYYIIHVRVGEKGDWDSTKVQTIGNETSYEFTGLEPFTVYVFRVIAVNALGYSKSSKDSFPIVTLREESR